MHLTGAHELYENDRSGRRIYSVCAPLIKPLVTLLNVVVQRF